MRQRLLLTPLLLLLAAPLASGPAAALGFERTPPVVTLGAPLDIAIGLRLGAGESLSPECVGAEVGIGDAPLSREGVSAALETSGSQPAIRVRTQRRVDEPVVVVAVTAGCDGQVSRRYTLFADPPGLAGGPPAVATPPTVAVPLVVEPAAAPAAPGSLPATGLGSAAAPMAEMPAAAAPRRGAADSVSAPSASPARAAVPAATSPRRPSVRASRPKAAAPAGARLRLEAPAVVAARQALVEANERHEAELATARAAIGVAQAAAEAASARMAAVEASLDALKKDAQVRREEVAQLQRSVDERARLERWLPWLAAAVLALAALAGWLYRRLRQAESRLAQEWWTSAQADAGPGQDAGGLRVPEGTAGREPEPAAAVPAAPAAAAPAPTPAPLRDVSIDELLDVEQQAEFFLVLGQEDAAVDLLVGHLRDGGGASPLPYLRLLEIHHRRSDMTSYDQWRRRFEERFGVPAPAWSNGPGGGRTLADYPVLLARLQQAWPHPAEAMAELESLLAHGDGGTPLDLPAYRDLLFLFTIARDLQAPLGDEGPAVDVLLPLATGGDSLPPATDGDSLPPLELAPREARQPS